MFIKQVFVAAQFYSIRRRNNGKDACLFKNIAAGGYIGLTVFRCILDSGLDTEQRFGRFEMENSMINILILSCGTRNKLARYFKEDGNGIGRAAWKDRQVILFQMFIKQVFVAAQFSHRPVSVFLKKKLRMRAGETEKSVSCKDEKLFSLIRETAASLSIWKRERRLRGGCSSDIFCLLFAAIQTFNVIRSVYREREPLRSFSCRSVSSYAGDPIAFSTILMFSTICLPIKWRPMRSTIFL